MMEKRLAWQYTFKILRKLKRNFGYLFHNYSDEFKYMVTRFLFNIKFLLKKEISNSEISINLAYQKIIYNFCCALL